MRTLSSEEVQQIRNYLLCSGISYDPLKVDLLDHVICDVEMKMNEGRDFAQAWESVKNEIPENHLKNIEEETMEVLNKRNKHNRLFIGISVGLLAVASFFKFMHLAGASLMLILFLFFISGTLLFGSARNVYVHRKKKGNALIVLVTFLLILFIGSWCMKLMQVMGADQLQILSILSLCVIFPLIAAYFYRSGPKLTDHRLIKFIDLNLNTLESTLVIMTIIGIVFNFSAVLSGQPTYIGVIFIIFTLILTGLYVYTLTWRHYVNSENSFSGKTNLSLLIVSSVALVVFLLPALGNALPPYLRSILALGSFIIFACIVITYYIKYAETKQKHKSALITMSAVVSLYTIGRLGISLEWFTGPLAEMSANPVFNVGFLIFLGLNLIIFRKYQLFKLFILMVIASYMIPGL